MPYNEEDIANLRKIFDLFDKDSSGVIEIADMHELMQSLGKSRTEAQAIVEAIDASEEDRISFQEFIHLLSKIETSLNADDSVGDTEDKTEGKLNQFLQTLEQHRVR